MDTFLQWDQQLFLFLNHLPHAALLDWLGLLLSGIGTVGIVWFVFGVWLFFREEKKDKLFFLPLVLAGLGSLVITDGVLKPLIARVRPTVDMGAIILGGASGDYSFPSGHATMAFAAAYVLSKREPTGKWFFYLVAILISFSRIYIGKHYPLDVTGGALVGYYIGVGAEALSLVIMKRRKRSPIS